MSTLTAKNEIFQHLETDISANQCPNIQSLANIAESSLCHQRAGPAPMSAPCPHVCPRERHKTLSFRGVAEEELAEKCSTPRSKCWLKSQTNISQEGISAGHPSRASQGKNTEQTKTDQLIWAEHWGKTTQPAWFVLPLPGCALERCSVATGYSLPSASWARPWQTPCAHTALPGTAGNLWGAGSAPSRRPARSHPSPMPREASDSRRGCGRSGFD